MKKSLILIALGAAAILSSCTKVEVKSPSQKAITFKAFNYKTTKAAIESTTFPTTGTFTVSAAYTAENYAKNAGAAYIKNVDCAYTAAEDIWNSETPAYWPLSGYLTFAAVSPAGAGTWADDLSALTVTGFTSTNQNDLMYCAPADCFDKQNNSTDYVGTEGEETPTNQYGVNLIFHHALSLVEVRAKAKAGLTGVAFEITGLTLSVKDNANLTVTDAFGSTPNTVVAWTTPTGTYENDTFLKTGVTLESAAETEYVTVTADGKKVLVVPQALAAETQTLTVTYTMTYNGTEAGSTTKTIDLATAKLTSFEPNKKYILNLELSADVIKYAPSIADWETPEVEEEYVVE